MVSIVGTRDISPYGKEWCTRTVAALSASEEKPVIVSGMAIGVDITAQMAALGYDNVFIGTVEGEPEETACENIINAVSEAGYKTVVLRPLMVVAGDHANNDMADQDDPESWYSQFSASEKFAKIDCQIAGLGRIPEIQALYVEHTGAVIGE